MTDPRCPTTLAAALDEIEEFFDEHQDGAPDAPAWCKECGVLLEHLRYARSLPLPLPAGLDQALNSGDGVYRP